MDLSDRGLHFLETGRFIGSTRSDAERNRGTVHRDPDKRLALAADHVREHGFEIALAHAEAFDPPVTNYTRRGQRCGNGWSDGIAPHCEHLRGHSRQRKYAAQPAAGTWHG